MAEQNMRLRVMLDLADRALGPLKRISQGSKETAATLKAAREQLKQLNETQKTVGKFTEARKGLGETEARLKAANAQVKQLATSMGSAGPPTKAMAAQFAAARTEAGKLGAQFTAERQRLQQLRDKLGEAGISTKNLASHDQQLRASIASTTAKIQQQSEALKRQGDEQRKLSRIQQQAAKGAAIGGGMAAAGAVSMYAGRQVLKPVQATASAYAQQEDASTQLKASMMGADGSVSAEFAKIDTLAKSLGDRLPGTTADFIEMMTMLKRQGLSDQVILGGTGEAAALLGVQLKMPVTAAAEFAAKMQDATRTTEKDMLGLMDTIQRSYYLGVDSGNMLQGFTKISPVLSIMRKEGLEASKMLAPLLVMMDQAGMDGGSAGNAYRKIFQAGMNTDKIKKVTDGLKVSKKLNLDLDFTDGKGEFGGIEKMYAQLEKLKGLNTETRLSVIKDLFGDDSETLTVLNTMISKGQAGYDEVVAKMQAQAGLQSRVNQQLGTLSNVMEAAQGSATNTMAEIGATMAPDLKRLVDWMGAASGKAGAWIKEHQQLVRWLGLGALALAGFMTAVGVLLIPLGLLIAKGMALRWVLAKIGIGLPSASGGLRLFAAAATRATKAGKALPAALTSFGTVLQAPLKGAINQVKTLHSRLKSVPGQQGAFARMGTSMAGSMRKVSAATQLAYVSTRDYLLLQSQSAVSGVAKGAGKIVGGARRGAAAATIYAAQRGPVGMAKDAMGGLAKLGSMGVMGVVNGIASAFMGLGRAIAVVGRALLLNPMGLAITAIAVAAMLILKYWQPIKAFFQGFWQGFTQGLAPLAPMFSAAFGVIGNALAGMRPVWDWLVSMFSVAWSWISKLFAPFEASKQSIDRATQAGQGFGAWLASLLVTVAQLVGQFFTFGGDLVNGLINGITNRLGALKDAVVGAATSAASWFKEKLGINSPSRVFTQYGGWISEGAALGIEGGQSAVRAAALSMAASAMVPVSAGATEVGAGMSPMVGGGQALAPRVSAGAAPSSSSSYSITINPAPGMDPQAIARAVAAELDRRELANGARRRSSMQDMD